MGERRRWFDDAAGPVVRPSAVTRGRTRSRGRPLDLIAVVVGGVPSTADRMWLEPKHLRLLARCCSPITIADLASDSSLPRGVDRNQLGDLRDRGLATVSAPA